MYLGKNNIHTYIIWFEIRIRFGVPCAICTNCISAKKKNKITIQMYLIVARCMLVELYNEFIVFLFLLFVADAIVKHAKWKKHIIQIALLLFIFINFISLQMRLNIFKSLKKILFIYFQRFSACAMADIFEWVLW